VKLHTENRIGLVFDAHQLPFPSKCDSLKSLWQVNDDQRVIARCLKWTGDTLEKFAAIVINRRSLAVHQTRRTHHPSAEYLADALVTQTHSQHRARKLSCADVTHDLA